jgi:hypothetical protein
MVAAESAQMSACGNLTSCFATTLGAGDKPAAE